MDQVLGTSETAGGPSRDTVSVQRDNPAQAHFTGPVTFTDLDLKTYTVLVTKVLDGCRVTVFGRKDRTRAYLIIEGDPRGLTEERLGTVVRLSLIAMVSEGWDRIRAYLKAGCKVDNETVAVVVAEGRPPVNGEDSKVFWPCGAPANYGAGKESEDGRVDYRERQSFVLVKAGDMILQVEAPTKGTPGSDYMGKPIPALNGEWDRPLAGTNVRATNPSQTELYATSDGALSIEGDHLHVRPMVEVLEVNFQTGNIRFSGDVSVSLGVKPGFEIEATGMVQIGGDVTQGTVVGGHVFVLGRTVGSTITAQGKVEARIVENSTVRADGDIVLMGSAVALKASCGGRLKMPEHQLAGGHVNCIGGAEIGWLGGSTGDGTVIDLTVDSALIPCLEASASKLAEIQEQLGKLTPALEPIRKGGQAAMSKLPEKQRSAVAALLKKADELDFALSVAKSSHKKLLDPILAKARPEVVVKQGISDGAKVVIGDKIWVADREMEGSYIVSLVDGKLLARPT